MDARLDYTASPTAGKTVKHFVSVNKTLKDSPLPAATQELVALRVSQINGCAFCIDMHTKDAAAAGERGRAGCGDLGVIAGGGEFGADRPKLGLGFDPRRDGKSIARLPAGFGGIGCKLEQCARRRIEPRNAGAAGALAEHHEA